MDLKDLHHLMERFEKSGLSELTWRKDGDMVRLRKGPPLGAMTWPAQAGYAPPHPTLATTHSDLSAAAPANSGSEGDPGTEIIKAPLVGTFYRTPTPDAAAFVEKGDRVKRGQTLCILEAMKLMNEFQAEFDLEVVEILVDNGKMVDFGAPLFEVRRK